MKLPSQEAPKQLPESVFSVESGLGDANVAEVA